MRHFTLAGFIVGLAFLAGVLSGPAATTVDADQGSFVTRNGTQLLLDGQSFRFAGLNIYNANSDGWCWYQMTSGSALDDALTAIGPRKAAFRAWFFQPLATTGGVRDWAAFDHTLSVAEAHGRRVIVTLTDQWGECGILQDGGTNYYKTKDWYVSGYKSADPGMLSSYRDWVAEVVTRYKDNPTVLMWQLINEAEVKGSQNDACLPGTEGRDVLIAWASDVSGLIKSLDTNHLVSLGTIGGGQCATQYTEYQDVHAISTIDVCEYHDYSPNNPMPGDPWNGLQFRIDQCNALNKPIFVGETGIIPAQVGGTYDDRAAAFQAKLDAQCEAGIDGILAWAWSNLGSTLDNFDIGPGDPALAVLAEYNDSDGDGPADVCDNDDDGDGYWDADETAKGSVVLNAASTPEHCEGTDEDGDTVLDEAPALSGRVTPDPMCAPGADPDGDTILNAADPDDDNDGFNDANERSMSTDELDDCRVAVGHDAWPPDADANGTANVGDVITHFGGGKILQSVGQPFYSARSDADGSGAVNVGDVISLFGGGIILTSC